MEHFKTIKIVSVALGFLLFLLLAHLLGQGTERPFDPIGPLETASFEKALDRRLAIYAWGIWPRDAKFDNAIPGQSLPIDYVERLKTWLTRILKKDLLAERIDPNGWRGIRKLDGRSDFIVGQFKNVDQIVTTQFRADGLLLGITALSKNYFPNGVDNLTNADIVKAATSLVNYPQDKLGNIIVEKHIEYLGEGERKTLVCYGKLKDADYNEMKPPILPRRPGEKAENMPTWWNHFPFWIIKGKIFIAFSMVNWETFPASLDPYVFKLE